MEKVKLYCIPHAGGSAMMYNRWKRYIHPDIELYPVELAGRGHRINLPLYNTLNDAVNDVLHIIEPGIEKSNYALIGHSMGSWIVFELYRRIKKMKLREPLHIFLSGKEAPHIKKEKKIMHRLPDNEFKEEIMKLGGTPKEIFENDELVRTFLPILKADYRMIETHEYIEDGQKFDCPTSFLNGKNDDLEKGDIEGWNIYFNNLMDVYNFNGGHFFIYENAEKVTEIINVKLTFKGSFGLI